MKKASSKKTPSRKATAGQAGPAAAAPQIAAELCFYVVDGSVLKSLDDLHDAVKRWSDDVFYYHVNDQKNDLGNWVRDVFGMQGLADRLYAVRTLEDTAKVLREHARSAR